MRLINTEVDNRIDVNLDKAIAPKDSLGIMTFGKNNDYPYVAEKLINGSITAKAAANIYAKFLTGNGFNDIINKIVIGKDERNKPVTVLNMLRKAAMSFAYNNGCYIHANQNMEAQNTNLSIVPFKYCRFTKIDDTGYTAKIAVYNNWDKHAKRFEKEKVKEYNVYNVEPNAFAAQVADYGGDADTNVKAWKGQIYFLFLDDQYLYPLSPFDVCYLDCDTENQISIYKNNMTRNGMLKKTVLRLAEPSTTEDEAHLKSELKKWQGAEGATMLTLFDDFDPTTGDVKATGSFKIDTIDSNIDAAAFGEWQKELANNIRKSMKALPAILIDYEEGKLSTTSGESIVQATNFYNAITKDDRAAIAEMFKELLKNTNIKPLQENTDWTIKPITLYEKVETIDSPESVNQKAQAELRGSVGGVTALIALQQSVSQKLTTIEAGAKIIMEIYGIDEVTAKEMLGNPKTIIPNGQPTNI